MSPDWLTRRLGSERSEEFREGGAKRGGQTGKCNDADVSFAALDAADVIAMEVGSSRKLLLRDVKLLAQGSHASPNRLRKVPSHEAIVTGCTR